MSKVAEQYTKIDRVPDISVSVSNAKSPHRNQAKRFSMPKFIAAWNDQSIRTAEICQTFNMAEVTAKRAAKALNLPRRRIGRHNLVDDQTVSALWIAGVSTAEIAVVFGSDRSTVWKAAESLGLSKRGRGWVPRMTLAEYRDTLLSKAMARDAAAEQRQMILAEMADWNGPRSQVGAEKGRAA